MTKRSKGKNTVKKVLEWADQQDEKAKLATEAKEPKAQAEAPVEPEVMDMDDYPVPGQGVGGLPQVFSNNVGRPTKFNDAYVEQAKILCSKGFIDLDLADFFLVAESTISLWKLEHPEFSEALKAGKALMDSQVEMSLLKRALGYSVKEEKVFCSEGEIVTHDTVRHYPPDPTSMIFWLKNRKPKDWRDKHEVDFVSPLTIKMDDADQRTL